MAYYYQRKTKIIPAIQFNVNRMINLKEFIDRESLVGHHIELEVKNDRYYIIDSKNCVRKEVQDQNVILFDEQQRLKVMNDEQFNRDYIAVM